jgi:hypothetical protein
MVTARADSLRLMSYRASRNCRRSEQMASLAEDPPESEVKLDDAIFEFLR